MERHRFPMCCGATILCDFGNTNTSHGNHGYVSPADVEKFLQERVSLSEGEWPDRIIHDMDCNAFHMAILNKMQHEVLHGTFIKCGFELVKVGGNNHSGSDNYLYVRVEHAPGST